MKNKNLFIILLVVVVALLGVGYSIQNYISGLDVTFTGTEWEFSDPDDSPNLRVDIDTEEAELTTISISPEKYKTLDGLDAADLASITSLSMQTAGKIDLEFGPEPLVEVFEGGDLLLFDNSTSELAVLAGEVNGSELEPKPYHFRLVLPNLESIVMIPFIGAGEINLGPVAQSQLNLTMTTSGSINAPAIDVETLNVDIFGDGDINLGGTVSTVDVNNEGEGNLFAKGLNVFDADVTILSNGSVELGKVENLTQEVSGNGNLDFVQK